METALQRDTINRRLRRMDPTMIVLKTFSATSMAIALTSLVLIFLAQPVSFFPMDQNLGLRTVWDTTLVQYLGFILVMGIVVGIIGLVVNSRRLKRSYDYVRVNLVAVPLFCMIGLLIYLL